MSARHYLGTARMSPNRVRETIRARVSNLAGGSPLNVATQATGAAREHPPGASRRHGISLVQTVEGGSAYADDSRRPRDPFSAEKLNSK